MPELPEIEHLRRTLTPHLVGRQVARVEVRRRDVVCADHIRTSRNSSAGLRRGLLEGSRIGELHRHGKQLAIFAENTASILLVQLGMSGQLIFVPAGRAPDRDDHLHVIWHLTPEQAGDRLVFRDPRRFGGLTLFDSLDDLGSIQWSQLGPDALTVRHKHLREALIATKRPIKAALLDQHVVAGIGNIYADEALFRAGIHPLRAGCSLDRDETNCLCQSIRHTLRRATGAGGTTLRDYVDGNGRGGRNRPDLFAYGRSGQPCRKCGAVMEHLTVAQRTTTFCPRCQGDGSSTTYPQCVEESLTVE